MDLDMHIYRKIDQVFYTITSILTPVQGMHGSIQINPLKQRQPFCFPKTLSCLPCQSASLFRLVWWLWCSSFISLGLSVRHTNTNHIDILTRQIHTEQFNWYSLERWQELMGLSGGREGTHFSLSISPPACTTLSDFVLGSVRRGIGCPFPRLGYPRDKEETSHLIWITFYNIKPSRSILLNLLKCRFSRAKAVA